MAGAAEDKYVNRGKASAIKFRDIVMYLRIGKVALKDGAGLGVNFAGPQRAEPGTMEAEVEASAAGEEGADGKHYAAPLAPVSVAQRSASASASAADPNGPATVAHRLMQPGDRRGSWTYQKPPVRMVMSPLIPRPPGAAGG